MDQAGKIKNENTIMVVDDEPDIVRVTCLQLNARSYSTVACHSAAEAITELRNNRVDLVLTDIRMPEMSGIELLDRIHELYPHIPVILMTAYADLSTTIDAIRKGAFDFIIKPFSGEQLLHSVGKAIKFKAMADMEKDYRRILEDFNSEIETLISERTMNLMALSVADKVRNPTTVIGGLCRQMLGMKGLPEQVEASLRDIREEAGKLEKIVSDFQAVLNSRKSLYAYEDLNFVVGAAVALAEKDISRKGLFTRLELSADPIRINMEKNLIRIAVFQLLVNAIEASGCGDTLTIKTMQDGQTAVLVVSDTGSGINPKIADKIFEPIFSTKPHGFGMGLPLVKQIVTEHMGEISVVSEPGKGTSFRLVFPLRWKQEFLSGAPA
jgi:signal transduction histidine kinase